MVKSQPYGHNMTIIYGHIMVKIFHRALSSDLFLPIFFCIVLFYNLYIIFILIFSKILSRKLRILDKIILKTLIILLYLF